jgi:serralysin
MGGRFSDAVPGSDGIDKLSSFGGSDMLDGGAGNDRIQGGTGRDELAGGYDSDVFVYRSARESKAGAADVITDFASGEDRIDLAAIDADSRSASVNESFRFIGSGGFTTAGDLRITALGMLEADTDGDGDADFAIKLPGRPHLVESDFIL